MCWTELANPSTQEKNLLNNMSFPVRILSDENRHEALFTAYDNIVIYREKTIMTTKAASHGEPSSIYASTQLYSFPSYSFLPQTIRDLRIGQPHTGHTWPPNSYMLDHKRINTILARSYKYKSTAKKWGTSLCLRKLLECLTLHLQRRGTSSTTNNYVVSRPIITKSQSVFSPHVSQYNK